MLLKSRFECCWELEVGGWEWLGVGSWALKFTMCPRGRRVGPTCGERSGCTLLHCPFGQPTASPQFTGRHGLAFLLATRLPISRPETGRRNGRMEEKAYETQWKSRGRCRARVRRGRLQQARRPTEDEHGEVGAARSHRDECEGD